MSKRAKYDGPPGRKRPLAVPAAKAEGTSVLDAGATDRGANYTAAELEFLKAVQRFQKRTGKKFPSHVDYLRVLLGLGYAKGAA